MYWWDLYIFTFHETPLFRWPFRPRELPFLLHSWHIPSLSLGTVRYDALYIPFLKHGTIRCLNTPYQHAFIKGFFTSWLPEPYNPRIDCLYRFLVTQYKSFDKWVIYFRKPYLGDTFGSHIGSHIGSHVRSHIARPHSSRYSSHHGSRMWLHCSSYILKIAFQWGIPLGCPKTISSHRTSH